MKLKILLLSTIIFILLLAGAVSATDSGNVNAADSIADDIPLDNITVKPAVEHDITPVILASSETGTFDDLQVEINDLPTKSTLTLTRNYTGNYGSRIHLDKDLIIDGQGHTLDCQGQGGCSAFYSTTGNIVLKNIRIINGHNDYTDKGGAIYIEGSAKYTLENCEFENNWADDYGGAIYNDADNELIIKNCRFTSNKVDDNDGGAIYSKGQVNIENSIFENNNADVDGGAIFIESNVYITNSTFQNNRADGATNSQCYGGAIRAKHDVNINNSTFKDNYAADYGGAIYANNIHINCGQKNGEDINTFFINNKANDNDGGAIYVDGSIDALNTEFSKNSALVDGGAIFTCENVVTNHCLFESNQANGAKSSKCYGGAIRAKVIAHIINSTFKDNHADDRGGAIHSTTIQMEGENIFEKNVAGDHGGAIYTETFIGSIINGIFIDNNAQKGDGGAIYVNSKGNVIINHCQFINNKCHDEGGAVYLDSMESHLWLTGNIFYNNIAREGYSAFSCGKYEQISTNFWAGFNPSSYNNQLARWGIMFSDDHLAESSPLRLDALFDWRMDDDEIVFNAIIRYLTPNNEIYNIKMVDANCNVDSNGKSIKIENLKMDNNQISFDFHPPWGTSIVTIHYGQITIQKTITLELTSLMGAAYNGQNNIIKVVVQ